MDVTVTVSDDVAGQVKRYTADVSATVERLLLDFVREQRATEAQSLHRQLEAWNAYHAEYGLLSDELDLY